MNKAVNQLSPDEALLLQEIKDLGEETLSDIAWYGGGSRSQALSKLSNLKRKGLVEIRAVYGEAVVSLSKKGKKAIVYLWPDNIFA